MCLFFIKQESKYLMLLKVFLSFFMFFSLSTWVFANPCEEAFSSSGSVFVSFVKKQMGKEFETELPANWSAQVTENTKHWTPAEASQFLDFLIHREGELSALKHIKSLAYFPNIISFRDLMDKINFYDQIHRDIVHELLSGNRTEESFDSLITNNNVNKVKIQQVSQIIEKYIGKAGVPYVMRDLILDMGEELSHSNPKEIGRVIDFVDRYTKKHGVVTDTMDNRVSFFKQFVSLPREEQKPSKIRFSNLSELKEFSELVSKAVREKEREIATDARTTALKEQTGASAVYSLTRISTFSLQFVMRIKVINLLSAYHNLRLSDLKKTIRILELYLEPAEVADILMNKPDIYMMDPKRLKEVIVILETAYNIPFYLQRDMDEMLGVIVNDAAMRGHKKLTSKERKAIINHLNKTSKAFINYLLRNRTEDLLLTNPTHLENTISILERYVGKTGVALILRMEGFADYHRDILMTNPDYIQKVINVLEKYFEKDEMTAIVGDHFSAMGKIKDSDAFTEIVEILGARIDQRSIFFKRITELLKIGYEFFPLDEVMLEIRNALIKMSNTLDHRQMKKILENTHLSELSPLVREMKERESEEELDFH